MLTDYAVDIRYPFLIEEPTIEEAKEAIEMAEKNIKWKTNCSLLYFDSSKSRKYCYSYEYYSGDLSACYL